jgi:hypothetical protein
MKGIMRILMLLVVVTMVVGCATYRLESPAYTESNTPDAVRVYVEPYHFVDGPGVGRLKGDWQRDEYIKSYLAKIMPVVFTDKPNDAAITVVTQKMWYSDVEVGSRTMLNGKLVKTGVYIRPQWKLADETGFEQMANGDGKLMAELIVRAIKGQNISSAHAIINHDGHYKFSGITDIKFE